MNQAVRNSIREVLAERETWHAESVLLDVHELNDDGMLDPLQQVNFAACIGPDLNDPQSKAKHNRLRSDHGQRGHRYYLGEVFSSNNPVFRMDVLFPYIQRIFREQGHCQVVSHGWKVSEMAVVFICERGKIYQQKCQKNLQSITTSKVSKRDQTKRCTFTTKPVKQEDCCNFYFRLYWDDGRSRWYFYQKNPGCRFHSNHLRKDAREMLVGVRQADQEALDITRDGLSINLRSSEMAALAWQRSQELLSTKTLVYHHRKSRHSTGSGVNAASVDSPADRLLSLLESSKGISSVVLTAEVSIGQSLVTVVKKKSRKVKNGVEELSLTYEAPMDDLTAANDSPDAYAKRVYNSLSLTGTEEILLSVAWISDDSRRQVLLFPEILGVDYTYGTNSEGRHLLRTAGYDAMFRTFPGLSVFLPSACRWVFHWVSTVAIPQLVDPRVPRRVRLIPTDGEEKLYSPFVAASGPGNLFELAIHQMCSFHNLTINERSAVSIRRLSQEGKLIHSVLKKWLYSLTNDVEREVEWKVSITLLDYYLSSELVAEKMGLAVIEQFRDFVRKSVEPHERKLAFYVFKDCRVFEVRTTSFVEREGGVLKHHAIGPKPQHSIDKSLASINNVDQLRSIQRAQREAREIEKLPINEVKRESNYLPLYEDLTDFAAAKLVDQFESREVYTCYRVDAVTFLVKAQELGKFDHGLDSEEYYKSIIPRFERTRVVTLNRWKDSNYYLSCSCCHFQRWGISCGHVFCVTNELPHSHDVIIRWHLFYTRQYGRGDNCVDALIDDAIDNEIPGLLATNPLQFRTDLDIGQCDLDGFPLEYFQRSLPTNHPVLHPGTFWGSNISTLPQSVSDLISGAQSMAPPAGLNQYSRMTQVAQGTQPQFSQSSVSIMDDSTIGEEEEIFCAGLSNVDQADISMLSHCELELSAEAHEADLSMLSHKSDTEVEDLNHGRMSGEYVIQGYPRLEDLTFSEEEREDMRKRLRNPQVSAYQVLMPLCEQLASQCGNNVDLTLFAKYTLTSMVTDVLRVNYQRVQGGNQGRVKSLPAKDKRKKSVRIRSSGGL